MMNDKYNTTESIILAATVPDETNRYKPVSHRQLIDLTREGLDKSGLIVERETYRSYNEGLVASGNYLIKNIEDSEMALQVGWLNSYNKTKPLIFTISTMVKVCNNGMFASYGVGRFKKKHMGDIQSLTPHIISEYIKGSGDVFNRMQDERDRMKNIFLSKREQAELIGRAYLEHEFIKSVQLSVIRDELKAPTHDYGDANSLWSLFNYTTFAMRELHPSLHAKSHIAAHQFFTGVADIKHPTAEYSIAENINQLSLELL